MKKNINQIKLFRKAILCASLISISSITPVCIFAEDTSEFHYNSYKDVGYVKPFNWEHAQGLCTDGIFFYFAGHNDSTGENADIHKIRIFDNTEVNLFSKAGPLHSAELLWFQTHDSLLGCSGGNNRKPFVWEINKNNGKKINSWNFEGLGENGGALIAWVDGYNIILFTSSQDGARIAFNKISLGRRGLYINEGTWSYSSKDLGVPQGLDYRDGYLYYLADAGKTVSDNPHIIYKIKLKNNPDYTVSILEEYHIDISDETEGLTIDPEGNIYFGTASEKIYKLDKPYNQLNKKQ